MLDSKVANPDMSKSWPVGTPLALVECLILSKQISPRRRQGLATTVSSGHCPERGSRLLIAPEVAEVPLSPPHAALFIPSPVLFSFLCIASAFSLFLSSGRPRQIVSITCFFLPSFLLSARTYFR